MRWHAGIVLGWALAGCGTNRPEIPPELLGDGGDTSACDSRDYPPGPYGSVAGEVARDACFQGWLEPATTVHDPATLEPIAIGDFHDPTGEKYELILLNTSAVWCMVCRNEHKTLPTHYGELAPRGLVILSTLFQDAAGKEADFDDLKLWVDAFHVNFPMALDPEYQLGIYAAAETAPLNLVLDARTMTIVEKFVGDQGSVLWPLIEDELAKREAE